MLSFLRVALMALLVAVSMPAHALRNYQDMWWLPTESGWGLKVLHQGDTISAVLFHYRSDRKPVWYLLSNAVISPAGEIYSGTLFETNGPPLFGAFDPATVTTRAVGTMTLRFDSRTSAQVDYSIDGQLTSKPIQRITFKALDVNGSFIGAQTAFANCSNPAQVGNYIIPGSFVIAGGRLTRVTLTTSLINSGQVTCEYLGAFPQAGSLITGMGDFSCRNSNGATTQFGQFEVEEMHVSDHSVTINFRNTSVFPATGGLSCVERGVISGTRLQNAN